MDEPTKEEIEDFIKSNDVDERAAADLRDCPPDVQRRALTRGDLSSARNPSAALLARIRDARVEVRGGGSGGIWMGGSGVGLPSTKSIEDFIHNNKISDSAAKSLRDASPTVKRAVLACGQLSGSQDPSKELLERMKDPSTELLSRDVKVGGSGWSGGGLGLPSTQDVEDFIKDNDVDGRAAADLRDLPPALQRAVLVRGDLRSARNPSSALIARIRDAKLGVPGAPGGGGASGGDGSMMGLGDMPPGGYPFPPYGGPMPGMPPGYPPPGYGMYPPGGYPGGWYPGYPGYPGAGGYGGYPGYPGPGGYGYAQGQGGYGSGGGDPRSGGGGRSPGGRRRSKGRSRSGSSSYSGSSSRSRSRSRGRGGGGGGARGRKGRSRRR